MIDLLQKIIKRKLAATYIAKPGKIPPSWERFKDYIDIHPTALIAPTATLNIYDLPDTPAPMLKIGKGSHIFGHFNLLRKEAAISIGDHCQIGNSHFITALNINVGNDVLIAWGNTLMDNDSHAHEWNERKSDVKDFYDDYLNNPEAPMINKKWNAVKTQPISIGDKCWLGFNVIILKGVLLGEETVVGAGSVVTKSFGSASKIAGNPAKVIE